MPEEMESSKRCFFGLFPQISFSNSEQDGAPCHTMGINLQLLDMEFDGRVVSRRAIRGVEWPPRLPDLNPCDFFLWGYLKKDC